jgi:hypothetical protein
MLQTVRSPAGKKNAEKNGSIKKWGASKLLDWSARDKEHSCVAIRDVDGEYNYGIAGRQSEV